MSNDVKKNNPSLAIGAELNADTWNDFVDRLRHDCVGAGANDHCTSDAIFTVQAKRLHFGIDLDYGAKKVVILEDSHWFSPKEYWDDLDDDEKIALQNEVHKDFDECFTELNEDTQWDILSELDDHTVTGCSESWEYVNSHLTKDAAEAFIQRKKHDYLEGMRVYVESQYHAWEFNAIKDGILSGQIVFSDAEKDAIHSMAWLDKNYDELLEVTIAMREYIDALPKDLVLPAMPGFDRDWTDDVIERCKSEK